MKNNFFYIFTSLMIMNTLSICAGEEAEQMVPHMASPEIKTGSASENDLIAQIKKLSDTYPEEALAEQTINFSCPSLPTIQMLDEFLASHRFKDDFLEYKDLVADVNTMRSKKFFENNNAITDHDDRARYNNLRMQRDLITATIQNTSINLHPEREAQPEASFFNGTYSEFKRTLYEIKQQTPYPPTAPAYQEILEFTKSRAESAPAITVSLHDAEAYVSFLNANINTIETHYGITPVHE